MIPSFPAFSTSKQFYIVLSSVYRARNFKHHKGFPLQRLQHAKGIYKIWNDTTDEQYLQTSTVIKSYQI